MAPSHQHSKFQNGGEEEVILTTTLQEQVTPLPNEEEVTPITTLQKQVTPLSNEVKMVHDLVEEETDIKAVPVAPTQRRECLFDQKQFARTASPNGIKRRAGTLDQKVNVYTTPPNQWKREHGLIDQKKIMAAPPNKPKRTAVSFDHTMPPNQRKRVMGTLDQKTKIRAMLANMRKRVTGAIDQKMHIRTVPANQWKRTHGLIDQKDTILCPSPSHLVHPMNALLVTHGPEVNPPGASHMVGATADVNSSPAVRALLGETPKRSDRGFGQSRHRLDYPHMQSEYLAANHGEQSSLARTQWRQGRSRHDPVSTGMRLPVKDCLAP